MYKEIVKPKPIEPKKAILYVIYIILFIMLFTALCNILYTRYRFSFINYMVYLVMVCIAWNVFRKRVVEYRYSLIGDDLIFEKLVGRYHTVSLNVKLDDMLGLFPMDSARCNSNIKVDATYKFAHVSCKNKIYCGIFKYEDRIYKIFFQPDQTLLQLLNEWKAKNEKQTER